MKISNICPETCIIFVSYGRASIAEQSFNSLLKSIEPYRQRVKLIISDASNDLNKIKWVYRSEADDVIITPRPTSAATSRNLATSLILDKYSPKFLCMLEDDFEYHLDWYPNLVDATERLYGVISPLDLTYGIFSTSSHHIPDSACEKDEQNNVNAYIFGAVAYQRFVLTHHYLSVMKNWDSDLLGISYAQTGGQTFRNTMRGFCGAILPGNLSWPIDIDSNFSTWSNNKREPGPAAHSFILSDYDIIKKTIKKIGSYDDER